MIKSIKIQGYRGFSNFEMSGLKRVSLLVGTNNSGKTSALEALLLLASQGDPVSLWRVLWRRSERMTDQRPSGDYPELDLCHVFHGHDLHLGSHFSLEAENQTPGRKLTYTVGEIPEEQRPNSPVREGVPIPSRIGLHIKGTPHPQSLVIPLSRSGGLSSDSLNPPRRVRKRDRDTDEIPSQFITAESYSSGDLLALWDTIALTPNEERVLTALRLLEPDIERIAATASTPAYFGNGNERGGFRVRFKNNDRPVPIGSMGDGMWRLLVMAFAIAQCKDGILLIDEIDTGLHYSVMTSMWKLIYGAAKELNVQVFATTHSYDCVKSLAEVFHSDPDAAEEVTLQRIERGKKKAVPYTAKEIEMAALHQIEVR